MKNSRKRISAAQSDPLNLPALKKRYDELKEERAEIFGTMENRALAWPGPEFYALEKLLIAKEVLPAGRTDREIYDDVQKQNQELTAELAEVRAKLAEHEGKEQRFDLVRRLVRLDDHNLRLVRAALDCLDRARGCNTPAEEFVSSILSSYVHGPLTPGDAENDLTEFRDNYNSMVAETKNFLAANPQIAKDTSATA